MSRQFIPFDDSYRVSANVRVSRGVRTGKSLFICGQMDLDAEGNVCNSGDLSAQTHRAMTLLCDVIKQAGMAPSHAVQVHAFYRGAIDEVSYRREILNAFPQFASAALVLTPVASYPAGRGSEVEIDAIVVEDDYSAIVEDESGRVVGARRGEWLFVQAQSTSTVMEAEVAEIAARVHRTLYGLRADINDVCRVNAYFSAGLDADTVERAERQLAQIFTDQAPTYHGTVLPVSLPNGTSIRVEVVALRGTDGSRLARTQAVQNNGWRWPRPLPYSQAIRTGDYVFVSSQLPLSDDGTVCHPGDISGQTHVVMNHMKSALNAVGADLGHMTKVNAYFEGNNDHQDWSVNVGIRSDYYVEPGPASTGIEVAKLSASGALISADCVAVVD